MKLNGLCAHPEQSQQQGGKGRAWGDFSRGCNGRRPVLAFELESWLSCLLSLWICPHFCKMEESQNLGTPPISLLTYQHHHLTNMVFLETRKQILPSPSLSYSRPQSLGQIISLYSDFPSLPTPTHPSCAPSRMLGKNSATELHAQPLQYLFWSYAPSLLIFAASS